MKKHHIATLNPFSWLILALGACSAKTMIDALNPIPVSLNYRYVCSAGTNNVGIRDIGGAFSVYKNNQILFNNHHNVDLSFFITTQEPTGTPPTLQGFALENQAAEDLEYFALNFKMNLETGILSVEEERYTRTIPTTPWVLSATQEVLSATSCHLKL